MQKKRSWLCWLHKSLSYFILLEENENPVMSLMKGVGNESGERWNSMSSFLFSSLLPSSFSSFLPFFPYFLLLSLPPFLSFFFPSFLPACLLFIIYFQQPFIKHLYILCIMLRPLWMKMAGKQDVWKVTKESCLER